MLASFYLFLSPAPVGDWGRAAMAVILFLLAGGLALFAGLIVLIG